MSELKDKLNVACIIEENVCNAKIYKCINKGECLYISPCFTDGSYIVSDNIQPITNIMNAEQVVDFINNRYLE